MTTAVLFRESSSIAVAANERAALESWLREHGHAAASWYVEPDGDVFARERKRPILRALLEDCAGRTVTAVVVPDLNSLGARAFEILRVTASILDTGANLIVISPAWNFAGPGASVARAWTRAVLTADGRSNATAAVAGRVRTGSFARGGGSQIVWNEDLQRAYNELRGRGIPLYRIAKRRLVETFDRAGNPVVLSERWLRRVAEPRFRALSGAA